MNTDLVQDDVTVCGELQPVLYDLQPPLCPHPDKLLKVLTVETLSRHSLGVTLRPLEVPVREDGLVRVSDNEDSPSSELSHVTSPPGETVLAVAADIQRPVVRLLQDGRAVLGISGLAMVASTEDALVIEDGASEDPSGGLHQVPDPGVAGARVGDDSQGRETVSHQEPGPVV